MMSEKRFEFKLKVNFIDEETGEEIYHKVLIDNSNGNEIGFDDMAGLLNEQQSTIEQLQKSKDVKEFSALFNQSIALKREIKDLKKENEKLTKMLNANYKTNNELVQYIQMLESDNDE